jgi:hypothetical protein
VLRRAAAVALLAGLVITGLAVWGVASLLAAQERRLLETRTSEVGLVLTQAANAIPERLRAQGAALRATDLSVETYRVVAATDPNLVRGTTAYAWLTPLPEGGFRVLAAVGTGLEVGDVVAGERADALARALTTSDMVPTTVSGPDRLLGFALGPPAAPPGTVMFQQSTLGPVVAPPRQAGTDPFSEVDVALYAAVRPDSAQIIVGTTSELPLTGKVHSQTIPVGSAQWLLSVRAQHPLVGTLSASAPWLAAVLGLIGSLLTAVIVDTVGRRREAVLALYAAERSAGEALQHSLLPQLPELDGLDVAARYLTGTTGQQVGGDWFDVFPLADGSTGIVIGDVMGHDLAAAGAMAQIRSALRAYALDAPTPALVLDQLDRLVTTFDIAQLATVLYGVLGPATPDGSRQWSWSNAGHPQPLLRRPTGETAPLSGGESLLLGTPVDVERVHATVTLPAGSSLLLFTDGLIEVPGTSLDEAVAELCEVVQTVPAHGTAEQLCAILVTKVAVAQRRDDIAVLTVRLGAPAPVKV